MGDSNDTMTISTTQGDVVVRRMPLADYAELLRALDNLPEKFNKIFGDKTEEQLKGMSNAEYIGILPQVLAESWTDVIEIVAVPTDKDAEFMGKLDFADAVDVVAAIVELNDIPRIVAAVKKMLALKGKMARPKAQK